LEIDHSPAAAVGNPEGAQSLFSRGLYASVLLTSAAAVGKETYRDGRPTPSCFFFLSIGFHLSDQPKLIRGRWASRLREALNENANGWQKEKKKMAFDGQSKKCVLSERLPHSFFPFQSFLLFFATFRPFFGYLYKWCERKEKRIFHG
jgi:hypothetical protein